jgi:purine-cytosine permease-like protein
MMEKRSYIPDTNQNFWQLAAIQSTALGLQGMLIGGQLARQYSAGTAIIAVCIGNLLLWAIAYSIVSMSLTNRRNAIENIKNYIGTWPCIFGSLFLATGFLSWTIEQNNMFVQAFGTIVHWEKSSLIILGVFITCIIALLSLGTIRLIKKVCVYALPFLLFFIVYHSAIAQDNIPKIMRSSWNISFFAIIGIIAQNLAGVVNLPTFFRHTRSKQDAFLALAVMTGFVSIFQIFSIVVGIANPIEFFSKILPVAPGAVSYIFSVTFVVLTLLCVNLVNIYFASAGWETISNILTALSSRWKGWIKQILQYILIPHNAKYATALGVLCMINGLLAAAFYVIFPRLEQSQYLEGISDNILASLGIVLMLAFLIKIIEHHRPRPLEKHVSATCWAIGIIAVFYTQIKLAQPANQALVAGVMASFLAYTIAIFIEVTHWSIQGFHRKRELLGNKRTR